MSFGSLSSAHQIMILLSLKGGPEYAAQMEGAAASTGTLGKALLTTSAAMDTATKRSWLHNQALFTARRYAFYATLAVSGLTYEVFKLGMSYNSTVQSARVALKGMFDTRTELNNTIKSLYQLSTFSPFLFKDTLTAFRTMAPALKNAGIGPTQTIKTLHAVMDALSQSGRTIVGSLTRVGVQLQHLANIGRPTGQIILALARDGLPVYPAFRKELGLTGTSLEQMGSSGITAAQAIDALNKFIETSPIYQGQAFKQATQTLQGNWQMFKDILAQAAGSTTGGLFSGLTKRLRDVNNSLRSSVTSGKNIGLTQIFQALNQGFTPKTDLIIHSFIVLSTAIHTTVTEITYLVRGFDYLITGVTYFLKFSNPLLYFFTQGSHTSSLFGVTLGTIITLFLVGKLALMPFVIAMDLWKTAVLTARAAAIGYRIVLAIVNGEWATAWALVSGNTVATTANTTANEANTMSMAQRTYIMGALEAVTAGVTAETELATTATLGWSAALLGILGPAGILAVGGYLLLRYKNQLNGVAAHVAKHLGATSKSSRGPQPGPLQFFEHPLRYWNYSPAVHDLQHHAYGGYSGMGGPAIVGENGPELVNLPGNSKITPLGRNAFTGAGSLAITVEPQDIYLDGKKIAQVMADVVTNKEARMGGRNI